MDPVPEGDVRQVPAMDVEPVGIDEDIRVPVGGPEQDEHALAGPDELPAHLGVGDAGTADEGIQDTIAKAYTSGTGTLPRVLYRATYLAQHAGQPRFYD